MLTDAELAELSCGVEWETCQCLPCRTRRTVTMERERRDLIRDNQQTLQREYLGSGGTTHSESASFVEQLRGAGFPLEPFGYYSLSSERS